jgi:rhodanese-related sulfurtransferase
MYDENIAKGFFILMGVAVICAFTVNFFSPKGIALVGEWDTSKGVITAKAKDDAVIRELEIEDPGMAKALYDKGYIFVDARSEEVYEDGHIKGSVSMPIGQFDEMIVQFIATYSFSTPIVTYCSGRECDDSHKVAQYLKLEGYSDVHVFIDGYPVWEQEGYPIE